MDNEFNQQLKTAFIWLRESKDVESSAIRAFLVELFAKLQHNEQETGKKLKGLQTRLSRIHAMVADYDGETVADRVAGLKAIVDKLPKTADGVPISVGDNVWRWDKFIESAKQGWIKGVFDNAINFVFHEVNEGRFLPTDVYSTREAADAIKDKK